MKAFLAALFIVAAFLFAQEGLPPEIPDETPVGFWGFSPTFLRSLSAPVEASASGGFTNTVTFPASAVFETIATHDTLPPYFGAPMNVFANNGVVSGQAAGQYPKLFVATPDGSVSDLADMELLLSFTPMDSLLEYDETIGFIVSVRYASLTGNYFSDPPAAYPFLYTHSSGSTSGGMRVRAGAINLDPPGGAYAAMITIARDDRDSYTGNVGVPYYVISFWDSLDEEPEEEGGGK